MPDYLKEGAHLIYMLQALIVGFMIFTAFLAIMGVVKPDREKN